MAKNFDPYPDYSDDDVLDELEAMTEGTDIVIPDDPMEQRKLLKKLWKNPPPLPEPKGGPDVGDYFFGIKLNRLKESRMKMMNRMAQNVAKADGVRVFSEADGNPIVKTQMVGLEVEYAILEKDTAKAFKDLVSMGDSFFFFFKDGKLLFSAGVEDAWDEWREATDEELEKYDPFPEND